MYLYKKINIQAHPICSERAKPNNVLVGDIVRYIDKMGMENFCKVEEVNPNTLKVTELHYFHYHLVPSEFRIDPSYNKDNYSHKGFLNYNGPGSRKIMIVDRDQLQ